MTEVTPISAFTDNYILCLHDDRYAIVVDPGDAAPVFRFLEQRQLQLVAILITHHHPDHIGGKAADTSSSIRRLSSLRGSMLPDAS